MLEKRARKRRKYALAGSVLVTVIFAGFLWNTFSFYSKLNSVIQKYILDANQQIAENMSSKLKSNREFIADFADTLSRMPEHLLTEEMLERKAEAAGLDKVVVITSGNGQNAECLGDGEKLLQWSMETENIWQEPAVSIFEGRSFLFSAPSLKDGQAEKLVIGLESYEAFYSIYQKENQWKQGARILADGTTGEVLMLEMGNEFELSENEIEEVLKKQTENKSDSKTAYKDGYVISMEPVEGTDWIQYSVECDKEFLGFFSGNIRISLVLIVFESISFIILFFWSRQDMKRKEQMLLTDPITGGYNREGFLRAGQKRFDNQKKDEYTVVCLNICDFRKINDLWGEEAGNQVLRFVYRILAERISEQEMLCRNSMDHFVILMHEKTEGVIRERIWEMLEAMNGKIAENYYEYHIEFSIGCCPLELEEDIALAINKGLYVSKQKSEKNVCYFYDETAAKKLKEEYEISELFEESLKNHDFKVYLQPKVSEKGECKAEALVRWQHPQRGFIYPDQFIPLFEKNGKIYPLDMYVFEEVCKLVSAWMRNGMDMIEISVNLSRFTLKEGRKEIWENYKSIKEKYEIPDGLIEIELTETVLLDGNQIAYIRQVVNEFRRCGLKVALDDFGFAYSSLAILKELNVNTIKLDRSFFIDETPKSRRIVRDIIQLVHNLDMDVVAEGIEEMEQVNSLWESGCDYIQGYVYSKPLSIELFEKWRREYEEQEY